MLGTGAAATDLSKVLLDLDLMEELLEFLTEASLPLDSIFPWGTTFKMIHCMQ